MIKYNLDKIVMNKLGFVCMNMYNITWILCKGSRYGANGFHVKSLSLRPSTWRCKLYIKYQICKVRTYFLNKLTFDIKNWFIYNKCDQRLPWKGCSLRYGGLKLHSVLHNSFHETRKSGPRGSKDDDRKKSQWNEIPTIWTLCNDQNDIIYFKDYRIA